MSKSRKGMMIILSSPSGAGKTTLVKLLKKKNKNLAISTSHTTRPPRKNEKNGKDYYFVNKIKFKQLIKKRAFIEYATVFKNFYGTSKQKVIEKLIVGKNVLFDIDWQGTKLIKKKN